MTQPQTLEILDYHHYFILLVACLCTSVALLDFTALLFLSEVLSYVFFGNAPTTWLQYLQIFALFLAGYVAKPLGGLVLGRYGDSRGRKNALVLSTIIITIATFGIALLPSYAQVGTIAPILLIIARLAQGFALGGVLPSAWVFISEHLPHKTLGLGLGLIGATFALLTIILMATVIQIDNHLSPRELLSYGWRLLFLMGGVLGVLGIILAKKAPETPIFTESTPQNQHLDSYLDHVGLGQIDHEHGNINKPNRPQKGTLLKPTALVRALRLLPHYNMVSVGVATVFSVIISTLFIFIPLLLSPLLSNNFDISSDELYFGSMLGLIFLAFGCIFFGYLTDHLDAGRVLLFGGLFLIVQNMLFFYHLRDGGDYILVLFTLFGFSHGLMGALPCVMVRLFPANIRLTGVGVSYNVVNAIVGIALPLALGYASFYISFAPALYLSFVGLMAIFISFFVYYMPRSDRDLSR